MNFDNDDKVNKMLIFRKKKKEINSLIITSTIHLKSVILGARVVAGLPPSSSH